MSRNNVRGPTSALTEFLRESGITPTLIARRARQTDQIPQAGPSNLNNDESQTQEDETRASPRRNREDEPVNEYDSENLDEEEESRIPAKKRKLSKEQEKARMKAKNKNRKGGVDDSDDDSDEDEYTALSRGAAINRARAAVSEAKPPIGSFENCAKCEKQFTVTRYTMAANPGPGWLCHECAKSSGADPFKDKRPAAPRKRKAPEDKRKVISFEDRELPSLASLCIRIVSQHIENIEALGDVGFVNKIEIGKILSKNRSLTPENASLLYDVKNTELTLFDATKLGPNAFCTLASLNPFLESLRVDFCGRLNDDVVKHWRTHLRELRRLDLLGPFLVKPDAWQSFFAGCRQLTGFLITQSPRFDIECMSSLAQHCTNLTELRLSQIGMMSDKFLGYIEGFGNLTSLELSEPAKSLGTDGVVALLKAVGSNLSHLNLSKNDLLTDKVLSEGLTPNARLLTSLVLNELPEITDEAMGAFFVNSTNIPMHRISLRRCHELADEALNGLLKHSGSTLVDLDINNWTASNDALLTIGEHAKFLKNLDIGFCRQADDFVIKAVIDGCEGVKDISVFGCNKLTDNCPRKRGINIRGIETHTV
ncbi:RNI-like protein [Phellopilus nigrolimitatus]|nr:RNI-like protein [Phellopilus nigrolimitatus]